MDTASQRRPQPTVGHAYPARPCHRVTTRTARRTATLERTSPRMVKTARRAGVDITYLGIAPLFAEPRAYTGPKTTGSSAPQPTSATPSSRQPKGRRCSG